MGGVLGRQAPAERLKSQLLTGGAERTRPAPAADISDSCFPLDTSDPHTLFG